MSTENVLLKFTRSSGGNGSWKLEQPSADGDAEEPVLTAGIMQLTTDGAY